MSEKQVTMITLAVLAVVLLGGGAAIYYLNFVDCKELEEKRDALKVQVQADLKKKNEIPGLKEKLAQKEAEASEKASRIPNEDRQEYDRFIKAVERVRRQSRVFIWSAKHVEPRGAKIRRPGQGKQIPKDVNQVDYEFTCNGHFYSLLRFVNLIETDDRFLEVKRCSITKPDNIEDEEGPASLIRQMRIRMTTYAYQPKLAEIRASQEKAEVPAASSTPLPD